MTESPADKTTLEVTENKDNDSWLAYGAASVIAGYFIAAYFSLLLISFIGKDTISVEFKTGIATLFPSVFMLGGVLLTGIITGKTSELLKCCRFRNWKFYYLPEGLGVSFALLIVTGVVSFGIIKLLSFMKPVAPHVCEYLEKNSQVVQQVALAGSWWSFALFAAAAVFIVPVVEEIVFRGIIFSFVNRHLSTLPSVIITASVFAGLHMNIIKFFPLFILGVAFQSAFILHRSIYPSIIFHMVNNSFAVTLFFFIKLYNLKIIPV